MSELIADGERFIPGEFDAPALVLEHYQRYHAALGLVDGKVVLDIASGSGYGSYILSSRAQRVYGVEIDQAAVDYSNAHYSNINLKFIQGSVENIPLEDNSVDVVVSFETIEHIPQELQTRMIREVRRVLKDDGVFFISSPDKRYYSDERNYVNPFHVHELTSGEFKELLELYFTNVKIAGQRFLRGSFMIWEDGIADKKQIRQHPKAYRSVG